MQPRELWSPSPQDATGTPALPPPVCHQHPRRLLLRPLGVSHSAGPALQMQVHERPSAHTGD